ncbi:MAG: DUF1552 domain-containing protein [Planctomyces sp.]|nr:DUF1552 domain-containing protein [Planctomyces sp.]
MLTGVSRSATAADSKFQPLPKSSGVHPRIIYCYIPNGVNILEWMPTGSGNDYQLSPTLAVLEEHRSDMTVLTGLGHPASKGGHSGADTWLTGADLSSVPGSDYSNTVSVDQIVAAKHGSATRISSLQLSDSSGTGSAGHSHTLSFNMSGIPIPAENSPRRVFERLFVPESARDRAEALRRYAEKKSILDSVNQQAKTLRTELNAADQQKLDQYLTSVRETELRVEKLESWIDVPKPEIESKDLQLNSLPGNAHDRPMWIDVMMELCYLAFLTDTTRVITFEWSREAGGFGGGGENHHEFSHHGGDADMLKKLATIDRFHVSRLNRFLSFLKQTSDGDTQMLDHTMVVFGSGMNSGRGGDHSPDNLPLLVAGGRSFGLKHGHHLAFTEENHPPLNNLHLSLMNAMGLEGTRFADSTGTIAI